MNDKDSKDTITEGENLEEDEEEEEGGAETEEQSGNESEVNEPEEEVNSMIYLVLCISKKKKNQLNFDTFLLILSEALVYHKLAGEIWVCRIKSVH